MALCPNVFCNLCGIVLLPKPVDEPLELVTPDRPWYAVARAVYTYHRYAGDIELSAVGNIVMSHALVFPLDDSPTPEVGSALLMGGGDTRSDSSPWGFGFHQSCWQLLLARLGTDWDKSRIALAIFKQFYCMPCKSQSSLDFGHDYSGAAKTHVVYGPLSPMSQFPIFYADPSAVLLDDLEAMGSPLRKPEDDWTDVKINNGLLGRLPEEILHQIVCYLSYSQVKKIRLASRELARKTGHNVLPMEFWRNQFLPGFDASFLFADTRESRDWGQLFKGTELSLSGRNPSLSNRKRICGLIEPIASLVERDGLYENYIPPDARNERVDMSLKQLDNGTSFSGQIRSTHHCGPVSDGCRILGHNFYELYSDEIEYIFVSTVQFGSQKFISGFLLKGFSGSYHFVGLFTFPSIRFKVPAGSTIISCEVAFSARGLIGVQWRFSNNLQSEWVGQQPGKGIARGSLAFPKKKGTKEPILIAGLDHYKIVSLGLKHPEKEHATDHNLPNLSIASHLWIPCIPPYKGLIVTAPQPLDVELPFDPLVNIDFGGECGIRLDYLTRMVAHMRTSSYPIIGLDFHYEHGYVDRFGCSGDSQISFFIDGPGGERISEVKVVVIDYVPGMSGLEITTTYGRTAYFSTTRSRRPNANQRIKLHIPPGYEPTGFAARTQQTEGSSFLNLGLQYQPSETPLAMAERYQEDRLYPGSFDSRAVCEYQTYASFQGVRCITSFAGGEEGPRAPGNIAGLKLEYDAGKPPAVVGQLIQQHEEIGLDCGEQIEAMKVWLFKENDPLKTPEDTVRQGRVMAIEMRTTQGRCLTFRPPGPEFSLDKCAMREFVRNGSDNLMGICWVLNSCYDNVRAIMVSEAQDPLVDLPDCREDALPTMDFSTKYLDMVAG